MPDTLEEEVQEEIHDEVVETEEPQVEEEVSEEPVQEDWRDDQIKSIAQQFNWNDATVDAMGGKEAFYAAVTAASQARTSQGGEQPPAGEPESESPVLPELPELDLSKFEEDDPSLPLLKQQHESNKQYREFVLAQANELKSLKEQLGGFTQMQEQQQELAQQQWFDGEVKGVNPDVFGKDGIEKCSAAQAHERVEAYQRFKMLRQALPHESHQALFNMVMVGKTPKNGKPQQLAEKRSTQIQGGRAPQKQPEDKDAKYEEINRRMLGLS